jgi:hypothetical protein
MKRKGWKGEGERGGRRDEVPLHDLEAAADLRWSEKWYVATFQ